MEDQPSCKLRYEVDFAERVHHVLNVTLWIQSDRSGGIKLVFPVWTPGSYMVREYTRNIEQLTVSTHDHPNAPATNRLEGASEHSASCTEAQNIKRLDKNRWSLECAANSWVRVSYRLYCREMSVRTNWVEDSFGFVTGAAAFPYVEGRIDEAIEVRLLTQGWQNCATSLVNLEHSSDSVRLRADSFHQLVDAPIVVGNFPIEKFEVGGKSHYLANVGGDHLWDIPQAVADMQKIVTAEHEFWSDVPYEDYWFINLVTETGGGLEHDDSCVLMSSRWTMRRRESYLNWLGLVSHEFFHTWNVRRLRPKVLMNFDYTQEQYVRELWIAEGITSYFDDLLLVWAGLCSRDEYLCRLTKTIQTVQTSPGRLVQSLVDSSWDTWTKHYRPDENSPNARISYYLKGALLAWLLDTKIRAASGERESLQAVMRQLWNQFQHTGYTICDFERVVTERAGEEISKWLREQVREPLELDLAEALKYHGLRFKVLFTEGKPNASKAAAIKPNGCDKPICDVWIGSDSTASEGRLYVRKVFRKSPSDIAGLNVDDELIALDGYRLTPDTWPERLGLYQPGQRLDLLVARRGKLKKLSIVLGRKPAHNWQLEIDPNAPLDSVKALKTWLRLDS